MRFYKTPIRLIHPIGQIILIPPVWYLSLFYHTVSLIEVLFKKRIFLKSGEYIHVFLMEGKGPFMKYQQRDFDEGLKEKIKRTERVFNDYIDRLADEHASLFGKRDWEFEARFDQEGEDPFTPGYSSCLSIGIAEKGGELIDLHVIKIWECERSILGVPISKKVPGSKVTGEYLDESIEEVKAELREYVRELLLTEH